MSELPRPLPESRISRPDWVDQEVMQQVNPVENDGLRNAALSSIDQVSETPQSGALDIGSSALSSEVDISPAAMLGVTDGEFSVHRSDGTIENGWDVRTAAWKDKKSGRIMVTVEKPVLGEDGQFDVKDIGIKTFLDWQEPVSAAENSKSNEQISINGDEYDNTFPVSSTGFAVKRSDGSVESDWEVSDIRPDKESGKTYVEISKLDPESGGRISKKVSTDTLKEWRDEAAKPKAEIQSIDKESQADIEKNRIQSQVDKIYEDLSKIKDQLPEELRVTVWDFGAKSAR